MKKSILVIVVACLLMTGLLIACSPKVTPPAPTATTQPTVVVNIPVVASGTEPTQPAATVPAGPKSYTLDELKAMTDEQVRAFFDERMQGHHTIDWVLRKSFSVAEWKSILGASQHSDLVLTVVERDFLIDWIIKNHQP